MFSMRWVRWGRRSVYCGLALLCCVWLAPFLLQTVLNSADDSRENIAALDLQQTSHSSKSPDISKHQNTQEPSLSTTAKHSTSSPSLSTTAKHYTSSPQKPGPAKVLFLTYSRSGSSFLGEVINRNKGGFYHFEPLFGVYSALYAIKYGMRSMGVFEYGPGQDRWPPVLEAEVIAQQLSHLLDCKLDRLPVEVLQDQFSMKMNKEEKFQGYKKCLKNLPGNIDVSGIKAMYLKSNNSRKLLEAQDAEDKRPQQKRPKPSPKPLFHFTPAYDCKEHVKARCGSFFDGKREFACFENTFGKAYPLAQQSIQNSLSGTQAQHTFEQRFLNAKPILNTTDKQFSDHNQCIQTALEKSNACIEKLIQPCDKSTVRGAKVIRMRMENVAHLLAKSPEIKIVHYFRDPRGLELSRSIGMKGKIQREMIKDARLTCRKMRQDIAARKQLEQLFPDSFMVLRYEDLAINTEKTAKQIYDFIGAPMPIEVADWLKESTNSSSKAIHNSLGTSRKNSTQTALKWRTKMPQNTSLEIARICSDVLIDLGYDI